MPPVGRLWPSDADDDGGDGDDDGGGGGQGDDDDDIDGVEQLNSIPIEQVTHLLLRLEGIMFLVLVNAFLCWSSVPVDHKLISSTSC